MLYKISSRAMNERFCNFKSPFIVFTANVFALMGLRQLYFLLGDLAEARRRVDHAIALDKNFRSLAGTDPDLAPLRDAGWPDKQSTPAS